MQDLGKNLGEAARNPTGVFSFQNEYNYLWKLGMFDERPNKKGERMSKVLVAMISLAVGVLVGLGVGLGVDGTVEAGAKLGTDVVNSTTETITEARYKKCRENYLAGTECFQNQAANVCEQRIKEKCQ